LARARKLLRRVKAVKNIRTVTKTMEMVASARFKKAHDRAVAARPFTDRLGELVAELVSRGGQEASEHPLLAEHNGVGGNVLMVMTSNNGLCGPYNSNVLAVATRRAEEIRQSGSDLALHVVGKRGAQYLHYRKYPLAKTYVDFKQTPTYEVVAGIANGFIEDFVAKRISRLEVAYMQFISSGQQAPVVAQLLPLAAPQAAAVAAKAAYEFLPSPAEILDRLLPTAVRLRLYQCFLDAAVTEQIARTTAMRAATENADEMLHELTVRYNRMRQAQITTELAEIMGGAAGIK
jgi:F-type H+-transporting ATPase subunit gamma